KCYVEQMMQKSLLSKNEANNLTRALKGDTKKQGNWGEVILARVLERSGLVKNQEYQLQSVFQDEETRKIPDAIIMLPEEKHLIVDSKISLTAYERWVDSEELDRKSTRLNSSHVKISYAVFCLKKKNILM